MGGVLDSCFPPAQPPPRPAQPVGGKKRKRASEEVPDCKVVKPLLSGSIPVEQFVQTLEKVSACAGAVLLRSRWLLLVISPHCLSCCPWSICLVLGHGRDRGERALSMVPWSFPCWPFLPLQYPSVGRHPHPTLLPVGIN